MYPALPDEILHAALKASRMDTSNLPRTVGQSTVAELAHMLGRSECPVSRYELIEPLGRGGMGQVWRAIDHDLKREVAFKLLRTEYQISPVAIGRFVTESQIAGRLQHAGIVPVYELGVFSDGRVYLAMKLVHGQTLGEWLRTEPPFVDRVSVFVAICQTMAYAHSQGVLHRDLKPANVMLGPYGEAFVLDWGLAKYVRAAEAPGISPNVTSFDSETQAGSIIGTHGYMAPEHGTGGQGAWTETSDVYSLGVLLFEMLTGGRWIEHQDMALVSEPQLRRIVEKCLASSPDERWPDATALAQAVTQFQSDYEHRLSDAILARQAAEIRAEAERRRRHLWIALIASVALGAVGLTAILTRNFLESQARTAAETNRLAAVALNTNELLHGADLLLANGQHERANVLVGKAEGIVQGESEALQSLVRQRQADVRMLGELDTIRLKRATGIPPNTRPRITQNDRAGFLYDRDAPEYFARAFHAYGVDIERLTSDEVVNRLRDRVIRAKLVTALDEWATNAESREQQSRLRAIADQLDPQPNGMAGRVRKALADRKPSELLKIAAELSPTSPPEVVFLVARVLRTHSKLDQAVSLLTNAVARHPGDFWLNLEFAAARAVQSPNDLPSVEPPLAAALALSNGNTDVYTYVAIAHFLQNQLPQSEALLRRSLSRDPRSSDARFRLAFILGVQRRHGEARKLLDEILKNEPENPAAHFHLAVLLHSDLKTLPESVAAYRRAIELDANWPEAWNNMGNALTAMRKFEEARAAFAKALELRPDYPRAIYNRAVLDDDQKRTDDAIRGYRRVLELDEEYYEAAYNLAHDLTYQTGQFSVAIDVLEKRISLFPIGDATRARWQRLLDDARRKQVADTRLAKLLQSHAEPVSALEASELAVMAAWPHRKQFVMATQLWEKAFELDPKLADDLVQGYRYFAAGCAARAGSGREEEPTRMRSRALQWLQADLALRQKQALDAKLRPAVQAAMRYWLTDVNLTIVRDEVELMKLPESEREPWQQLWIMVRNLEQDTKPPAK